jgi:CheY-like chemotaxis protein
VISNYPVVLHVEDDPNDRALFRSALRRSQIPLQLESAEDGQLAIDYLSGTGDFEDRTRFPLPSLILLDLKMPRKTGFEVLEWIRQQPQFRTLPLVIFTSSTNESDVEQAYEEGANSYLLKPLEFEGLVATIKDIYHYWFVLSQTAPLVET